MRPSSRSTARRSRTTCWRTSSSATCGGRSLGPIATARGCSSRRPARRLGKRVDGVDNATTRGLMAAAWKGNIRELDNALERAVILAEGPILPPDDFPPGLIPESTCAATGDDLRAAVRDYERQHI